VYIFKVIHGYSKEMLQQVFIAHPCEQTGKRVAGLSAWCMHANSGGLYHMMKKAFNMKTFAAGANIFFFSHSLHQLNSCHESDMTRISVQRDVTLEWAPQSRHARKASLI
jgi:hypothetical protein